MYSGKFIEELFKPQKVYSSASTRQIFDKLAHASIMRLNKNSMDKLYDLMSMGFKYQMTACTCPMQLLHVTMQHLNAIKEIVNTPEVAALVDRAVELTVSTYGTLSVGKFWTLKHTLCRFFQDRRVKVSLFLQDGIQNLDGTIALNMSGPCPPGGEIPGTIKYFAPDGGRSGSDAVPALAVPGIEPPLRIDLMDPEAASTTLGCNMYLRDRSKLKDTANPKPGPNSRITPSAKVASPPPAERESKEAASPAGGAGSPHAPGVDSAASAAAGLNMLAGLVGGARADTATSAFKLNLFPGDDRAAGSGGSSSGEAAQIINIDATDRSTLQEMMDKLGFDEEPEDGGGKEAEDEDDLLSLLDRA